MEPQSQSHSTQQLALRGNQVIVFDKHGKDIDRLTNFIKKEWPVPSRASGSTIEFKNFCCPFVSTTLNSTVFVISIGPNSAFTRNSYSGARNDPWLIFMQNPEENPELAKFISDQWEKMTVQRSREGIDLIAKHIVYDASDVNSPPKLVSLECDNQDNVRARLPDSNITIWSHPPRDEALKSVIRETNIGDENCEQKLGNVRYFAEKLLKPTLPKHAWEDARRKARDKFNEFYENFKLFFAPEKLPLSFQWPTIQLKYEAQRYGNTFAGVYEKNDNEAHNTFPAIGIAPRNSKKHVYEFVMGRDISQKITFEDMMKIDGVDDNGQNQE